MTKTFRLSELDCANCAAKMERAIKKIEGVNDANVNFLTQNLTIEAEENDFADILEKAAAAIKKIDSECKIIS